MVVVGGGAMAGELYRADCDLELPSLIDAGMKFDLVLTDPPYNLGKEFCNDSDRLPLDDFLRVTRNRLDLCRQLLSENGSIVWFGIHDYIGFIQVAMYDLGLHYRRMLIWKYTNGFSRNTKTPATFYEPILWFSKSNKTWTYNTDDMRVPYKTTRVNSPVYYKDSKGVRRAWVPDPRGALRGDVWEYPTLAGKLYQKERTEHPTQKPEALMIDLVRAFCPKDDAGHYSGAILDPFAGSGTTLVACERLNACGHHIRWVGLEVDPKWVDVAQRRLDGMRD